MATARPTQASGGPRRASGSSRSLRPTTRSSSRCNGGSRETCRLSAILKSSTNYNFNQPLFVPAGFPSLGDTPVVGDYDGDGKADPGIWRSSQAVWIIPTSSSNYTQFIFSQWGQSGDIPLPRILSQN